MSIKKNIENTIREVLKRELLNNDTQREILTTRDAALYMGVSHQWLEIGRVKGYGPKFIKFGRMVRYRRETIDDYLKAREVENTIQGGANER